MIVGHRLFLVSLRVIETSAKKLPISFLLSFLLLPPFLPFLFFPPPPLLFFPCFYFALFQQKRGVVAWVNQNLNLSEQVLYLTFPGLWFSIFKTQSVIPICCILVRMWYNICFRFHWLARPLWNAYFKHWPWISNSINKFHNTTSFYPLHLFCFQISPWTLCLYFKDRYVLLKPKYTSDEVKEATN